MKTLHSELANRIGGEFVLENEPMSRHTSFRAGGPADIYVIPGNEEELRYCVKTCGDFGIPTAVIGNGSNILVKDEGFRGAVIELGKRFAGGRKEGNRMYYSAGTSLGAVANAARDASLSGLEFASGIPGNLGGGIIMNAGAYGGEIKDVLRSVRLMDAGGNITENTADELDLSYRHSNIPERGLIVISAELELRPGNGEEISSVMKELARRRLEKQPLEYPSAGSTFKRPEGYFAGKLIQDAGLMGFSVGGAQVSEKHAGFVINMGNATASDIIELTEYIMDTVQKKFGVRLEREIKIIG